MGKIKIPIDIDEQNIFNPLTGDDGRDRAPGYSTQLKETKKQKNKTVFLRAEATTEILILIISIFAFSYFADIYLNDNLAYSPEKIDKKNYQKIVFSLYERLIKILFDEKNFVSATELNEEQTNIWRAELPGLSDQEIRRTARLAEEKGYITPAEFNNREAIKNAAQRLNDEIRNAQESISKGANPDNFRWAFDFIKGFLPDIPQFGIDQFLDKFNQASGGGIYTCPETKDGKICQEYPASQCSGVCAKPCIQNDREKLPLTGEGSECKLGMCYDANEGICSPRSTQQKCKDENGEFLDYNTQKTEIETKCKQGCCLLGTQAQFTTEQQCRKIVESQGLEMGTNPGFDASIDNEPDCLKSVEAEKWGACVVKELETICKFTAKDECDNLEGNFHENYLCSNEELKNDYVKCEKQSKTNCVEGLDEIYWFDGCGNRENIYEGSEQTQKDSSWNNGIIKLKKDSCEMGDVDNPIKEQATCGNCNRFFGSRCGKKTETQKLNDEKQEVVCIDMGCVYDNGKRREHGESWCAYQSSIGLPGPDIPGREIGQEFLDNIASNNPIIGILGMGARSTDTPGSRHFRVSCIEGEIVTLPCENYRNSICVEEKIKAEGTDKTISQSACRKNRWQECLNYNHGTVEGRVIGMLGEGAGKISEMLIRARCMPDPDCFVKKIDLDKFEFAYCLPRYPPGFELNEENSNPLGELGLPMGQQQMSLGEENVGAGRSAADKFCSQATQECTSVWIYEIGGWTCKANCECVEGSSPESAKPSRKLVQSMNEMCTSLGDCGYKVNYAGKMPMPGTGFKAYIDRNRFSGSIPSLSSFQNSLLTLHPQDAIPTPGEFIQASSLEGVRGKWGEVMRLFDLDSLLGSLTQGGGNSKPEIPGVDLEGPRNLGLITGATGGAMIIPYALGAGTAVASVAAALGSAALGAGLGMAAASFLLDITGVGRGLSPAMAYTLVGAGAVGGAIIGIGILTGGGLSGACSIGGGVGCIVVIVVIIIILVLKIFGVGEVQEVKVKFECLPWEPPVGSKEICESCGKDDLSDGQKKFPCNAYSCEALGQGCKFVDESEGPEGENNNLCIYVSQSDVSPPKIIDVREDVLSEGFEYKDFSAEEGKFKIIKTNGEQQCLDELESVTFGFEIDEYGKCKISAKNPALANDEKAFEQMTPIASGPINYIYRFNSLMLSQLGFDEQLKKEELNEISLFIVCEDYNHVKNLRNPYVVNLCVYPKDRTASLLIDDAVPEWLNCKSEVQKITFNVDKPSECRWSYRDIPFSQMENNFDCETELSKAPNGLFQCRGDVVLIGELEKETTIYRRCLNHPEWKGTERENEREENQQSKQLTLKRTQSCLKIDSIKINEKEAIESEVKIRSASKQQTRVTIEVQTSGGVEGKATCSFKFDNFAEATFFETGEKVHKQILGEGTIISEGAHSINVKCSDVATPPNTAEKTVSFKVEIDSASPSITRIYDDSGVLYVITNEPSECAYLNAPKEGKTNACDFKVVEGERIGIVDGSKGFVHSVNFNPLKIYYIKCKDELGNEKSAQCDITVSGSSI